MWRFFSSGVKQHSSAASSAAGLSAAQPSELPSTFLHTLGWLSAGAGALGLGLVIGRELRQRYKFHRRTPYDIYAHAGDYQNDLEFGVGI